MVFVLEVQAQQAVVAAFIQAIQIEPAVDRNVVAGIAGLLNLASTGISTPAEAVTPAGSVSEAWQRVQQRGSYHFSSDVVQVTIPEATLTNVGRSSREERLYLKGQTDLRQETTDLKLWSDGVGGAGSVLVPESGIQVQVADGTTRTRSGTGDWEEMDGLIDGYAPQGDFMAYLAAMRDVSANEPEMKAGITFTRYSFTVDGPAYATYVRDQMERVLSARGQLPPGVQLEPSAYYADMTGTGELWVGADGLPLRQILDLRFPPQRQERVHVQISVIFSDYGQEEGRWVAFQNPDRLRQLLFPTLAKLAALLMGMGVVVGLAVFRRWRFLQHSLAVLLITLMVAGPLLSGQHTTRFFAAQRAHAAENERLLDEQATARELRELAAESTFDPHADALASLAQDSKILGPRSGAAANVANLAATFAQD